MWPREVLDYIISEPGKRKKYLANELEILRNPGVYVLYRDDAPYYVGKAGDWLWHRLHVHARHPGGRYDYCWNYFSVSVIRDEVFRTLVESILIAAISTANSAKPKLKRERFHPLMVKMVRDLRNRQANSSHAGDEED